MAAQLLLGISVICVTAYIHAGILALALVQFDPLKRWARKLPGTLRLSTVLAASVIWVMGAHLAEVAVWAGILFALDIFQSFNTAAYFALVAYTTLGFGDIVLPEQWRILSGMIAANGFLVFGWSTAFQVDLLADLKRDRI